MHHPTLAKFGLSLGLMSTAGAVIYWAWRKRSDLKLTEAPAAAFAGQGAHRGSYVHTRDAGPANMRDDDEVDWDCVDQSSDQSFPSSDPPTNNDFRTPEPIDYSLEPAPTSRPH